MTFQLSWGTDFQPQIKHKIFQTAKDPNEIKWFNPMLLTFFFPEGAV